MKKTILILLLSNYLFSNNLINQYLGQREDNRLDIQKNFSIQLPKKIEEINYITPILKCNIKSEVSLNNIFYYYKKQFKQESFFSSKTVEQIEKFELIPTLETQKEYTNECKNIKFEFKEKNLESSIIESGIIIDGNMFKFEQPSLDFSFEDIIKTLKENKIENIEIIDNRSYVFKIEFENNEIEYEVITEKDYKIREEELQKLFNKLETFEKYLVIFNKELTYLNINPNLKIHSKITKTSPNFKKVLGVLKIMEENEVLVIFESEKETLRLNFSLNEFYSLEKIHKANLMTQSKLNEMIKKINNKNLKNYEKERTKVSFNENKYKDYKNGYSKYNSERLKNDILKIHEESLGDNNYKSKLDQIKLFLFKID